MTMFKNWFVTIAGIMASMLGVPVAVLSYYATIAKAGPPEWFTQYLQFPLVLVGILGTVLLGVAAKGADQHSTQNQVAISTAESVVAQVKKADEEH